MKPAARFGVVIGHLVTTLSLIVSVYAGTAVADGACDDLTGFARLDCLAVTENTNRLLDWAESTFPELFAPECTTGDLSACDDLSGFARLSCLASGGETVCESPTQQFGPWLYRYYPISQTYAGVHTEDLTVHVLGEVFGPSIRTVGALRDLLALIDSPPD